MILGLRLINWKSFRDETIFSSYASGIKQHRDHISVVAKEKYRVLPIAMIFGGNTSGKSNFVSALSFLRQYVTNPGFPRFFFGNVSFLFSREKSGKPSEVGIQFLADEAIYDYTIAFDRKKVYREKLSLIKPSTETLLFSREEDRFDFSPAYTGEERARLTFAAQGTKPGQLFLSNSVEQNVKTFEPAYLWFLENLIIIDPQSIFDSSAFLAQPRLAQLIGAQLKAFDTGIERLEFAPVDPASLNLTPEQVEEIAVQVHSGKTAHYIVNGTYLVFSKIDDAIIANRVIAKHLNEAEEEIPMAFENESDGTRRLFDLIPAFSALNQPNSQKVVVIDELDRSLHTKLSLNMILTFLSSRSPESRSQLIFTTHDMMLLDQSKFRRDEIWMVERKEAGTSDMVCLSDFDIRYDLDIRKAYLDGRFEDHPYLRNIGG